MRFTGAELIGKQAQQPREIARNPIAVEICFGKRQAAAKGDATVETRVVNGEIGGGSAGGGAEVDFSPGIAKPQAAVREC